MGNGFLPGDLIESRNDFKRFFYLLPMNMSTAAEAPAGRSLLRPGGAPGLPTVLFGGNDAKIIDLTLLPMLKI
jgi:hypothetical protein